MNNSLIRTVDGHVYVDVTPMARQMYSSGIQLFSLFKKSYHSELLTIASDEDLNRSLSEGKAVCMYAGQLPPTDTTEYITAESWAQADKIEHKGFIYVRYSDLRFCNPDRV
jgi:hypothetical protein